MPVFRIRRSAFTLIELLIVVAIIAILAAIAVPNFLEAQTRAKVSRVKGDFRSVATAIESYIIDYNMPPLDRDKYPNSLPFSEWRHDDRFLFTLTSPVAYMSSVPLSPFVWNATESANATYWDPLMGSYHNLYTSVISSEDEVNVNAAFPGSRWMLINVGPDRTYNESAFSGLGVLDDSPVQGLYDATNGTVSRGDIVRASAQGQQ